MPFLPPQNDVSDIPDLTFSMDADEEKHILYEKNQVIECQLLIDMWVLLFIFFIFESTLFFIYLFV